MEFLKEFADVVLHLDRHLDSFVTQFGPWLYVILFLIIFCETGLVVMPFLPGDSLLFAAGMFAGLYPDALNIYYLLILLSIAAVAGDTVNYWFGAWFGPKAFSGRYSYLKPEYLFRAQKFYEKYGGRAIVLGLLAASLVVLGLLALRLHRRRRQANSLVRYAIAYRQADLGAN